jgi:hypothetical protein
MNIAKNILVAFVAAISCLVLTASHASASGRGGGKIAGPCGTVTSISASAVQLSAAGSSYNATALQIRGNLYNCSIYGQSYWIEFDEPTNPNPTCKASFWLFGVLVLDSGSTQGWTATTNTTPNGVTSTAGCIGTHTVRAVLRDRAFGSLLQTLYLNYSVTAK